MYLSAWLLVIQYLPMACCVIQPEQIILSTANLTFVQLNAKSAQWLHSLCVCVNDNIVCTNDCIFFTNDCTIYFDFVRVFFFSALIPNGDIFIIHRHFSETFIRNNTSLLKYCMVRIPLAIKRDFWKYHRILI